MALKKIVKVANVGRLVNLAAVGDVEFRRLTLIYGSNAIGKTTLTSVLRSLQAGDPAPITERATLGATGTPAAEVLSTSGLSRFSGSAWNQTVPELEIFDSAFVNENVYTGERIDPEHRKNLYQVIVGSRAVALAREVDRLDAEGRATSKRIGGLEGELRNHMQAPFDLDTFLNLVAEESIDTQIAERTANLNAVRKEREVLSRQELERIAVPEVPRAALQVLSATRPSVAEEAIARVQQHFSSRLGPGGEEWVRRGMSFLQDDACPFCGQDTSQVEILRAFRDYFSDAYNNQLVAIQRARNEVEHVFGDGALAEVVKRSLANDTRIASWSDLTDLSSARFNTSHLEAAWRRLRQAMRGEIERKLAHPDASVENDAALAAAVADYEAADDALRIHGQEIERANELIGRLKKQAASTDAATLEAELRRLRNTQIRQQPTVATTCANLLAARAKRKQIEADKEATRKSLEREAAALLVTFQESINRLLTSFGASFRITGTKPSFAAGKASSTYQISINNVAIDLGDAKTAKGKPCFRTALSSGDKSTLALAFFMARLQADPAIHTKTVVFDDPLSSLDCFRVSCTQQEICKIAEKAEQVVVLSHDPFFLKGIYDRSQPADVKGLWFVRSGSTHTLQAWDIDDYSLRQAHHDYVVLRDFLAEGLPPGADLFVVARAIRPFLEGHLRYRFPDRYGPTECLGDFLHRIETAAANSTLAGLVPKVGDLKDLNDYARRFHHADASGASVTTSEDEVKAYAERALRFVQGAYLTGS